jgi:DNA-binding MarR family transcriptional regulator
MPLEPGDSPGFLLWHVTLRWQRDMSAALAPLDLTHVQFVLLATTWWLNTSGERPSQLTVARRAGTDVKMTSQVLRTLEAKGLLVRAVDSADTRARRLSVTDAGADLAARAVETVEAADAAFFGGTGDVAALVRLLRPLAPQIPDGADRLRLLGPRWALETPGRRTSTRPRDRLRPAAGS